MLCMAWLTVQEGSTLGGLQLGGGARQQHGKDGAEVLVHLLPRLAQGLPLLLVQLSDDLAHRRTHLMRV